MIYCEMDLTQKREIAEKQVIETVILSVLKEHEWPAIIIAQLTHIDLTRT